MRFGMIASCWLWWEAVDRGDGVWGQELNLGHRNSKTVFDALGQKSNLTLGT